MTFALPPNALHYLDQLVQAGDFRTREDAVVAAIDLMRHHRERGKRFRDEFEESIAQSDAGEAAPINLEELLTECRRVFEQRHSK